MADLCLLSTQKSWGITGMQQNECPKSRTIKDTFSQILTGYQNNLFVLGNHFNVIQKYCQITKAI